MNPAGLRRASALNFASSGISLLAALIVSVVLARGLGPRGFGLYALVMAVVSVAFVVARLGIPDTAARYAAELAGTPARDMVGVLAGRSLLNALRSGAVATIMLLALSGLLGAFFHQPAMRDDLLLGALLLLPMVTLSVLQAILTGVQEYHYLMQVNLVTSPVWVAGCSLGILAGAGVPGILLVTLVVELINLAAFGWRTEQRVGFRFNRPLPSALASRVRRYNRGLTVLTLLDLVVWQRSELLLLGWLSTPIQASFYAVPFALVEKLTDLIPGSVLGVLLPGLTVGRSSGDDAAIDALFKDALRSLALLTLPASAVGIIVAPRVIGILYGPGFEPAAIVLQILLLSMVFGVLGQASRALLLTLERQDRLVWTGSAAATVGVIASLALIPRWGAVGAAITNTLMQAAWTVAIVGPTWRHLRRRSPRLMAEAIASS